MKNYNLFSEIDGIDDKLKRACRQAGDKEKGYEGDIAVGLVFIRLHAKRKDRKTEILRLAQEFKTHATAKQVLQEVGADFLALYVAPYKFIKRVLGACPSNHKTRVLGCLFTPGQEKFVNPEPIVCVENFHL